MYSCMYDEILMLFRRAALQEWRRKLGAKATYNNLIKVFKQARYNTYADFVEDLVNNMPTDTEHSNRSTINQTPPPSLEPVFPSESEQFTESPSYAAAAEVKLVEEDYQLGTKVVNIIFEEHNNNVIINLPMMALALNYVLLRSYLLLSVYYTVKLMLHM